MREMLRRSGRAAVGLVALAGCGGAESAASAGEADVGERTAVETLSIGELEGPEAYTFGAVMGLARDGRGRIFVADRQAGTVRVYDSGGRHLFDVGRQGQGPGELAGPCCLAVDGGARLWIRETGNNRYSVFAVGDTAASFLETRRMAHGAGGMWAPLHVVGDSVVDIGGEFGSQDRLRWMVGPEGDARELGTVPGRELEDIGAGTIVTSSVGESIVRRLFYVPSGPRHLMAFGPGGRWADAVSSTYRVTMVDPAGDSVTLTGPAGEGPPLSERERQSGLDELELARRFAQGAASQVDFDVPERKPPLRDLFFDDEGRLWVERSVPDGAPRTADLYGPDGALLERRSWSGTVDVSFPGWVGRNEALGVRRDSLGVQRVVRLEWR